METRCDSTTHTHTHTLIKVKCLIPNIQKDANHLAILLAGNYWVDTIATKKGAKGEYAYRVGIGKEAIQSDRKAGEMEKDTKMTA